MAAILNLAILDSTILVLPLILTHTCQNGCHHLHKKKLTHISLPTICTKYLHSFILTQLDDHSHPSILPCWIQTLPSWIQTPHYLVSRFTPKHPHSNLTLNQTNSIWLKLIPSHVTWWWQLSWILPYLILPSLIQPFCTKLWLKLIQSDSNSFIPTQLDEGSHLEFCLLAFNHFAQKKLHTFILTELDDGGHL